MTTATEITLTASRHGAEHTATVVLTPEMRPLETTLRDLAAHSHPAEFGAAVTALATRVYGDGVASGVAKRAAQVAWETSQRLAENATQVKREQEQAERELHWRVVTWGPAVGGELGTGLSMVEARHAARKMLDAQREREGDRVTGATVRLHGYRTPEGASAGSISDTKVAECVTMGW